MNKINGTHIIGDFYECDFSKYFHTMTLGEFQTKVENIILKHELCIIGTQSYEFGKYAFSLNIMLSESHLCIHTWPESNYVSMDIFVCNYTKDNSENARNIFEEISLFFCSNDKKISHISR